MRWPYVCTRNWITISRKHMRRTWLFSLQRVKHSDHAGPLWVNRIQLPPVQIVGELIDQGPLKFPIACIEALFLWLQSVLANTLCEEYWLVTSICFMFTHRARFVGFYTEFLARVHCFQMKETLKRIYTHTHTYIHIYIYIYIYIRGLYHPRRSRGWYSPLIARYKLYHTPKQLITNLSHDCLLDLCIGNKNEHTYIHTNTGRLI